MSGSKMDPLEAVETTPPHNFSTCCYNIYGIQLASLYILLIHVTLMVTT